MTRFSKEALYEHLRKRIETLAKAHNFDPGNGTSQLVGKSQAAVLAYGEMEALQTLLNEIVGGYIKG